MSHPSLLNFTPITRADIDSIAAAKRTIATIERKVETVGVSMEEVEQFLNALAVIKKYPEWMSS